jgi:hypothetical protein
MNRAVVVVVVGQEQQKESRIFSCLYLQGSHHSRHFVF